MTSRQRILKILADHDEISSWQLSQEAKTARYGGRVHELRRAGIEIDIECRDGSYYYRLATPVDEIDFGECRVKPNDLGR